MNRPLLLLMGVVLMAQFAAPAEIPAWNPPTLWYQQPATCWMDALPVGNGRLGAMVFGGVDAEHLALNESTVWSGEAETPKDLGTREHLAEIRTALFEGRYAEAQVLCRKYMLHKKGNYCTHLPLGELLLRFPETSGDIHGYRRELDLDAANASVQYTADGVRYERSVLCSSVDQVLVIRLVASTLGALSFEAAINAGENPSEISAPEPESLAVTGHAYETRQSDGKCGVRFCARLKLVADGGRVSAANNALTVAGANAATIFVAINTDFLSGDPEALCREQIAAASRKPFEQLLAAHIADHQRLFRRVSLDLGPSILDALPTNQRLERVRAGGDDPELIETFFQYVRYLLIASSRENSPLPANLQGIWNDSLACGMGWTCDFHLDINTQQNYWPAEVCNLSECHTPLLNFIESLRAPGRITARETYGCPGWVCHAVTNAWRYTDLGWGVTWGANTTAGVWLASHLWEHYQFTGDRAFLAERAYPALKEAAEFFLAYLVEHPEYHYLVTGPAPSPENWFIAPDGSRASESMGPTCDTVLVRELFSQCIEANRLLGVDTEFAATLEAARAKLPPLKIGKHGQLQEWLEDFEDGIPHHRHMVHLIALYPFDQITPQRTPELAQAARVAVERRISQPNWEDVEWSRANLINFYARLGDGALAHDSVLALLRKMTDNNLLTFSAAGIGGAKDNIFVIDGNLAGAAGIAEMLLQSHGGEIRLLPALPPAWPDGQVKGLRARGGYEVDIAWRGGQLTESTIRATRDGVCRIRSATAFHLRSEGAEPTVPSSAADIPVKPGDMLHVSGI
ncbi:MAG: glycoside hydrolase N-terminal domain-containing protein [Candidatus Hydrogenedentes bacterium]|nr:glycoside hydrolase N-terminal domain-containing protein [Candidatus Hydrogenedentota bacterium]